MNASDLKPGDIVYQSLYWYPDDFGDDSDAALPTLEHVEGYRCVVVKNSADDGSLYTVMLETEVKIPDPEKSRRPLASVDEIGSLDTFHRTAREAILECIEKNQEDARKHGDFAKQLLAILPPA
jgi:hypothetical protein